MSPLSGRYRFISSVLVLSASVVWLRESRAGNAGSPDGLMLRKAVKAVVETPAEVTKSFGAATGESCPAPQQAAKDPGSEPDRLCAPSKAPLFQSEEPLEITVRGNLPRKLGYANSKTKRDPANHVKASIEYVWPPGSGSKIVTAVQMGTRGKARSGFCEFSPLLIAPPAKDRRRGSMFAKFKGDFVKLTVHCGYKSGTIAEHPKPNEAVLKEYFVYKALKAAGFVTMEVRLVKVTYRRDSDAFIAEGYGFLIEPKSDMARRCKAVRANDVKHNGVRDGPAGARRPAVVDKLDKRTLIPFFFAQQLATAWDWVIFHNDKLYGHNNVPIKRGDEVVAVAPYDFNDSILVNARGWDGDFGARIRSSSQWLAMLLKGPYGREGKVELMNADEMAGWKPAVLAEAQRVLEKKELVMAALKKAPFKDKDDFERHYEDYFRTLASFVGARN